MATTVNVDTREIERIIVSISENMQRLPQMVDSNAPAVAEVAGAVIMTAIEDIPTIGPFMAARTKVEAAYGPGMVVLTVSGMTEGEAGYPPLSGGKPAPSANLWIRHEYGAANDASSESQNFVKDAGGVRATREGRSSSVGTPYVGAVRRTVSSIVAQINVAISGVLGVAAYASGVDIIETATKGSVRFVGGARSYMQEMGIDVSLLASKGVSTVGIRNGGQVYVVGRTAKGGHTFLSNKGLGIPTTVRAR